MTPNVNDTIGISEGITLRVNVFIDVYESISPIEWFYRMPLWLDISTVEPVSVEETVYGGVFIPEALHVDVDFNDGSEYYVSFSYDITDGIIYVYQGTQLVYSTQTLFNKKNDIVNIAERITIEIITTLYISVNDEATVTDVQTLTI